MLGSRRMGEEAVLPNKSFREQDFWDEFFQERAGRAFEWYAEWKDLSSMLAVHCGLSSGVESESSAAILIPGCGNSELSAALYDQGFSRITNIDFCRGVIEEMLRRHLRQRPKMLWKVMDMTNMQFSHASFDVVLDKGALDAILGEAEEDSSLGKRYLSEVKRVLKPLGRYACVTLGEKHVIGLLLSTFRHGWKVGVHQVNLLMSLDSKLKPLLFVATKQTTNELFLAATTFMDTESIQPQTLQTINEENALRKRGDIDTGEDNMAHPFDKLYPSRRLILTLGEKGKSKTTYKAIILDAKGHEDIKYACAVFLVPKGKAHEWLYSSEEGQWQVLESAKAARLIMVYLETNLQPGNNMNLQDDLSPLVKDLLPSDCANSLAPFLMPDDGVCKGTLLEEIDSPLTGTMLVEDVLSTDKKDFFRRLFFKRNPNLIQSEALLTRAETSRRGSGKRRNKTGKDSHHKRQNSVDDMKVDHSYLASPYHEGMIAGLSLISSKLESWLSTNDSQIRVMVVGLGAGLLPMFLYKHFPFSSIKVVELDPVVGDLAKRHFDFIEDDRMQLLVGDGVAAVETIANSKKDDSHACLNGGVERSNLLQILIIDADSSDPSNGLSCPPMDFLMESFLQSAKAALVPEGILIINIVSRARDPHVQADLRLCKVFEEVYTLQVSEDVNRVVFALPQASTLKDSTGILNAGTLLKRIATQFAPWGNGPNVKEVLKQVKRLK